MLFDSIIALVLLVAMLSIGVPILFCFGGALLYMCLFSDIATMQGMMLWGFQQMINPILLCIPLFIFAGGLMSESGIADALLRFCNLLVGKIRGGLGLVSIVCCSIIGAISGSAMTGVAAIGPILIPRMEKSGYPRPYATVLVCCSSLLGLLIPPSVDMIAFGWVTGTSVLACFLATIIPGVILMVLFAIINWVYVKRLNILPDQTPIHEILSQFPKTTFNALPALGLPIIILGGIYGGIMTPTESAAVACFYAIPVGFMIYKGLTLKNFIASCKNSATSVGAIMIMIYCSLILSQQFAFGQLPQEIAKAIFSLSSNKYLILLFINVLLFILGMIVNTTTAIILIAPLLMPLIQQIGLHPVQFAAIMGVNLALGCITPPYAAILYFSIRVGKVEFTEVVKPVMWFILLAFLPVVIITSCFDWVSLFIPGALGYL